MRHVIVVGGGPAGLMAADVVSAAGVKVTLYERMPSVGRKLLMAGRGGLNLTHSEPIEPFLRRYGTAEAWMAPVLADFPPTALQAMAAALGQETFVGSSGRIFPKAMKASPLLRAWLAKLARQGVEMRLRHRLVGIDAGGRPTLAMADGRTIRGHADAVVLALGGASWPRLGSDGGWVAQLAGRGIRIAPLKASNVGVAVTWSEYFRTRHAGEPLKRIALSIDGRRVRGEAVVTARGLEGGAVYALTPALRAALDVGGSARLLLDLRPDLAEADLAAKLRRPRGKQSLATWLRKSAQLAPVAISLLREAVPRAAHGDGDGLAAAIKAVPLTVTALGGLDKAISTAGGIALDEVGPDMMLKALPGVFVAGEMLDWEAPTGGYLLQACFSIGHAAGRGVLGYLARRMPDLDQAEQPAAEAQRASGS